MSTEENPTHTFSTLGEHTIRLTVSGTCGFDTETREAAVTVHDFPTPGFTASDTEPCVDSPVSFTNTSTGFGHLTFAWDFGDGGTSTDESPSHTYTDTGSYAVSLTVTGSCGTLGVTRDAFINVTEGVIADFTASAIAVCAGQAIDFTNTSSGSPASFAWDFGDGNTSTVENPSHTYTDAGNYTVSLRVTGSCGSDEIVRDDPIAVSAGATAGFEVFGATDVCVEERLAFTNLSTPAGEITEYRWDFGDGGISSNAEPRYAYSAPGQYTVALTITTACGTTSVTEEDLITVSAEPTAAFSASPLVVCAGQPVTFVDESVGKDVTVVTWRFGDGQESTEASPTHSYDSPGTYSVELDVAGSCGMDVVTRTDLIEVLESAVASFDVVGATGDTVSVCAGETVEFANRSTFTGTPIIQWDFGDGGTSTEENPSHVYSDAGTYTVTLRVESDCGTNEVSRDDLIVVRPSSVAAFEVLGSTVVCVGEQLEFRDLSTNPGEIIDYSWDFGDNDSSSRASPKYLYDEPGVYTVTLEVETACGTSSVTKTDLITVHGAPTADFTTSSVNVCVGEAVTFTDTSVGQAIVVVAWQFGDGMESTEAGPSHAYSQPGLYDVELEIQSACGTDSVEKPMLIEVFENAQVDFEVSGFGAGSVSVCVDEPVQFVNLSAGAGSGSSQWSFGDGATSTENSPTHRYGQPGTYDVTLGVEGDCGDTSSTRPGLVVVLAPVTVAFVASATTVCAGDPLEFTHSTDGPSVSDFRWDFGDGSSSSEQNPSHTYTAAGVYSVTLTATGPCGTDTVRVVDLISVQNDFGAVPGLSYPASAFVTDLVPIRWRRVEGATAYRVEARVGPGNEYFELPRSPVADDPSIEEYELRMLVDRVGTWFFRVVAEDDCDPGMSTEGPPLGVVPEGRIAYWPAKIDCTQRVLRDTQGGHDMAVAGGGGFGCRTDRFGDDFEAVGFNAQARFEGGSLPVVAGDFALSFWVRPEPGGAETASVLEIFPDALDHSGNVAPLRILWVAADSTLLVEHNGSDGSTIAIDEVASAWHHLVISRENTELAVYFDGEFLVSVPHSTALGDGIAIGGASDGTMRFRGLLDQILYESVARDLEGVVALLLDDPSTVFLEPRTASRGVSIQPGAAAIALDMRLRTGMSQSQEGFVLTNLSVELRDVSGGGEPLDTFDFVERMTLLSRSSCAGGSPVFEEAATLGKEDETMGGATFTLSSSGDAEIPLGDQEDLCYALELELAGEALPPQRPVIQLSVRTAGEVLIRDGGLPAFVAGARRLRTAAVTGPLLITSSLDCNSNSVADDFEIEHSLVEDCNANGIPDACDIADSASSDRNDNGVPDECDIPFERGDCNGDESADITDGIFLLSFLFLGKTQPQCRAACDYDATGSLTLTTAVYLFRFLFLGGPPPLDPYGECGVGQAGDAALTCAAVPAGCL